MVSVYLTFDQMNLAKQEGFLRRKKAVERGDKTLGPSRDPLGQDIVGVLGELAFATWSGLPWTAGRRGDIRNDRNDVGTCEIRTRRRATDQDLFIKKWKIGRQQPSTIYVLAIADIDVYEVLLRGWTTLDRIAEFGYPRHHDCIGFNQQDLFPMELLNVKID